MEFLKLKGYIGSKGGRPGKIQCIDLARTRRKEGVGLEELEGGGKRSKCD